MNSNPYRKTATASFTIAFTFAIMIFVPEAVGIDGFDGGFAISFASFFIAIVGCIVGAVYLGYAGKLANILNRKGILAHWTYTPQDWEMYTKKEQQTENAEKKGLFLIISAFALFFGVLFWVLDPEAGFYVFLVMLGLIGLVLFAWRFTVWSNYRQNLNGPKEVYITKDAIYLNGKLYMWRAPMTSFKSVSIEEKKNLSLLIFKYTTYTRAGPQTYTTRVPIPPDQKQAAVIVMEQVNTQNKK
ncbi:MAG: hypothetical protein NWF01_08025 [Candidatus Bathyarchaeota archaeon]|nr:hypothetical protein [Candidatus Bathyarchaeota archaeon]